MPYLVVTDPLRGAPRPAAETKDEGLWSPNVLVLDSRKFSRAPGLLLAQVAWSSRELRATTSRRRVPIEQAILCAKRDVVSERPRSVGELDGAGIKRAADHARKRDIGLTESRGRDAAGGNRDRARGRALGHSRLVAELLPLRVFDGAELVFADLLRLEILGGLDHILERFGDLLRLASRLGAVERKQLAVALGVGGKRPLRRAAGRDLAHRARVVAPAREHFAEGEAAVGLGLRPAQRLHDANHRLVLAGRDVIAP